MAPRKKTLTLDKPTVRMWQILAVFILLSFLLRFQAIAGPVAKVISPNDPTMADKIMNWSAIAQNVLIGWFLISVGTKLLAVPWLGIPFVVVGAGFIVWSFWRIYKPPVNGNTLNQEIN